MKSFLEIAKPNIDPGVYMCAKFCQASLEALRNVQNALEIDNPVSPEKLHTTIVYSRKTVDLFPGSELNEPAKLIGFEKWDTKYGSTLVGIIESDYLHSRFNDAMDMGATYDYDDYKPHVTLSYDSGIQDLESRLSSLTLPVDLRIVGEHVEALNLDSKLEDIT